MKQMLTNSFKLVREELLTSSLLEINRLIFPSDYQTLTFNVLYYSSLLDLTIYRKPSLKIVCQTATGVR